MMKYAIGGLALVLAAASPSAAQVPPVPPFPVDCSIGESIADALAMGVRDILVVGTCTEDVEIRRDDVTLQGDGDDTVVGQIFVNGARRVTVQNLTVQGSGAPGSHGILALQGAGVTIANVLIRDIAEGNGVHLEDGSSATLDQATIRNSSVGVFAQNNASVRIGNGSVIEDNRDKGVTFDLSSSGVVSGATIRNSANEGVFLFRGSSAVIENSTIEGGIEGVSLDVFSTAWLQGNTIAPGTSADSAALGIIWGSTARLNGGNTLTSIGLALYAQQGSTLIQYNNHDRVTGPVQIAIDSNAEFRNVEITGAVEVSDHSVLRMRDRSGNLTNVSVRGNMSISRDSGLNFIKRAGDQRVRVVGNINCADTESSISAPTSNVTIIGKTNNCTGYNTVSD